MFSDQPANAEQWLVAIRDSDGGRRMTLIEDFYFWSRPTIRRAAAALAINAKITEGDGAEDVELVVTETLLAMVSDVIDGRRDPALGRALYAALLYDSRGRYRSMLRAAAVETSGAVQADALRSLLADLHLDRPHMARVRHQVSGDTRFIGPFPDVVEALRAADAVERDLRARDSHWKVTTHPLLDPGALRASVGSGSVGESHDGGGR